LQLQTSSSTERIRIRLCLVSIDNRKSYNTLLIPDLHKQQLLHFVYKYVHHSALLPEAFINSRYCIFNDEIHNYNTRTKTDLHLYYLSSFAGLHTTRHEAAVLWNELPHSPAA